eukprot:CAMPEP_0178603448 /NCGR_PEP_ID=MMETSP0697-20121206/35514_1 /TAXON_ID=265572 /ORGANISM="Extubocellulus spinifer, Strain CCMP396" /LENGTH=60 /DNA_ID=CAMNT_0020241749 /DNA_START=399 /DNA_END=577 /DNA_ORIENTATION=-
MTNGNVESSSPAHTIPSDGSSFGVSMGSIVVINISNQLCRYERFILVFTNNGTVQVPTRS